MSETLRYEIKLVVNEAGCTAALAWARGGTGLRPAHPDRMVHSLYFDSAELRAAHDNLDGLPRRRKIRYRHYRLLDGSGPNGHALELKYRRGRLGGKHRHPLPQVPDRSNSAMALLRSAGLDASAVAEPDLALQLPALQVRYRRHYLDDGQGLRMTVDRDIGFALPRGPRPDTVGAWHPYPHQVVELKFDRGRFEEVADRMRPLRITPQRHSKYVAGLAAFGLFRYF